MKGADLPSADHEEAMIVRTSSHYEHSPRASLHPSTGTERCRIAPSRPLRRSTLTPSRLSMQAKMTPDLDLTAKSPTRRVHVMKVTGARRAA